MPKYLLEVNYTLDGVRGLGAEGGTARVAAATALVESLGGKVESFYFAFGDTDAYVVIDLPNNSSAAAGALAVNIGGGATARTVALLSAAEVDESVAAVQKATYRPPGS